MRGGRPYCQKVTAVYSDAMATTPDLSEHPTPTGPRKIDNFRGILFMLAGAVMISCLHALVRDMTQALHPFEVAFFRNLVVLIALTPLLLRQDRHAWKSKRPDLQLVRGIVGLGAMLTWFYALSLVPVGDATALSFTVVLFTSLGAVFMLKEKMGIRRWGALIVGFAGTAVILRPGFQDISAGYLWALGSTVMWAWALLLVKVLVRYDSPVTIVFYSSVYFTPATLILALFVWEWPTWAQFGELVAIGLLAATAHVSMAKAMQLGEATAVMPADFTRLLWAAGLGYAMFGEFPDLWTWAGGTVVFASTLYITYREARVKGKATVAVKGTTEG
ncbi:MAG: RNA polymerase subunit sigma-54 [Rhodospirillales bacterium CG15_BIG_FIL_POST_REV_8_21_14_020_66_15]|nr:MAG: RNA polymerase subunit sigma-54 [Rhodospirillales bacterium CG15_BIG_FIL_POST_REV_8_21_14_020_66_15]